MLIFSFPNVYAHEWKCPTLSKLCFLDVSEHTVHFSRVAVDNLHPTHQRSKAPISQWSVLHFWFGHFFPHGPFARWKPDFFGALIGLSRLLGWPKRAYAFFPEYIQVNMHTPFLAKGIIVHVLPLFMCFQSDSNLPPEICFLQFCLAFKSSSLPSLNIFVDESYHL